LVSLGGEGKIQPGFEPGLLVRFGGWN